MSSSTPTSRNSRPLSADDPAPLAGGVTHAVQTFEYRRFAGHVIANRRLYPRHVVGVDQRAPVRRLSHVGFIVAQHGFPARRQVHPIVEGVEIPQAVVGAEQRQFIALFQIFQMALNFDVLQPAGQAAAHQFHEQMQLYFPILARPRVGYA
jgi:hypothetical protein